MSTAASTPWAPTCSPRRSRPAWRPRTADRPTPCPGPSSWWWRTTAGAWIPSPVTPPPPSGGGAPRGGVAGGAGEPVALVVAARHMEGLDGLGLLLRARELHPAAKRVLLQQRGEWTSGEAVVRALTLGQVDYLLFRPWRPREQFLYLPVSEFLAAWEKSRAPSPEAIQIVG